MNNHQQFGAMLKQWGQETGQTKAKRAAGMGIGESTLRRWESGHIPATGDLNKTLPGMIRYLFRAAVAVEWRGTQKNIEAKAVHSQVGSRASKVWTNPAEVRFWLALVGQDDQIEQLLPAEGDAVIKQWLQQNDRLTFYKPPRLPDHYIRTGQHTELLAGLIDHEQYSRPRRRVFVVYGLPGSGKTTLVTAVVQERLAAHFFGSGVWFLTEEVLTSLLQGDGGVTGPARAWREWLERLDNSGLVVVDDLTDGRKLRRLLERVRQRVSVVVTVQNPDTARLGLGPVGKTEVGWFSVTGLEQEEGEAFFSRLWQRSLTAEDRQYVKQVIQHLNRPEPLRLIAGQVAEADWERVWGWLYTGQDVDTPLLSLWEGLLEEVWQRTPVWEQGWLRELAGAISRGSHFGEPFAVAVWECSREQATTRLEVLGRRGWLERIAVQPETELDLVLGRQYRLLREGWTYVRHNHSHQERRWQRLIWSRRIYRGINDRMQEIWPAPKINWGMFKRKVALKTVFRVLVSAPLRPLYYLEKIAGQINRWGAPKAKWSAYNITVEALSLSGEVDDPFYRREDELDRLLASIWTGRGMWPPEEIWQSYFFGRWGKVIRAGSVVATLVFIWFLGKQLYQLGGHIFLTLSLTWQQIQQFPFWEALARAAEIIPPVNVAGLQHETVIWLLLGVMIIFEYVHAVVYRFPLLLVRMALAPVPAESLGAADDNEKTSLDPDEDL